MKVEFLQPLSLVSLYLDESFIQQALGSATIVLENFVDIYASEFKDYTNNSIFWKKYLDFNNISY